MEFPLSKLLTALNTNLMSIGRHNEQINENKNSQTTIFLATELLYLHY